MSLILEALKKSEQQRRLGEAPTLGSPVVSTRRRRNFLPVLAVLIVVAAAAGWWLTRSKERAAPPIAATPSAPMTAMPAPAPARRPPRMERATPAASAKPGATSQAPAAAPKTEPNRPNAVALPGAATTASAPTRPTPAKPAGAAGSPASQSSTIAPAKTEATAAQKPNVVPPKAGATAPNAEAPKQTAAAPARPAPAASAPALPTIWDLPYSTRKDLPAIELSMHVYSADPKQRFVVIKGERRVEGDDVSDDLVLREIRQDGIVLEFKGQRFFYPSTGR